MLFASVTSYYIEITNISVLCSYVIFWSFSDSTLSG